MINFFFFLSPGINEDKLKDVVSHDFSASAMSSQTLHNELINILIEIMRKCCQYSESLLSIIKLFYRLTNYRIFFHI